MKQPEFDLPQSNRNIMPDQSLKSPIIWIKEIRFYSELHPEKELRRIKLRPGLNILWAKPATTEKIKLKQSGLSGHSAGKTLFCRMLRYVLGESTFAGEKLSSKIREKFINGHVTAEVIIKDKSFLVVRSFGIGNTHYAVPSCKINKLFEEHPEPLSIGKFREYLDTVLMGDIPLKTIPGDKTKVSWLHMLPWLSRDQEARMSHLAKWRDSSSNFGTPNPDVKTNCHLIRGILNLFPDHELNLIEKKEVLAQHKNKLERNLPLNKYVFKQYATSLKTQLPDFSISSFENDNLFKTSIEELITEKENLLNQLLDFKFTELITQVEVNCRSLESGLAVLKQEKLQQAYLLQQDKNCLIGLENPKTVIPANGSSNWLDANRPAPPGRCNVPIDVARQRGCHLAREHTIDFESIKNLSVSNDEQIKVYQESIDKTKKYIVSVQEDIKKLSQKKNEEEKEYSKLLSEHNNKRNQLATQLAKKTALLEKVEQTQKAFQLKTKNTSDLKTANRDIEDNLADQKKLRDQINAQLESFRQIFEEILKNVLGNEIAASIKLGAEHIQLSAKYHVDLTSAAISTVKIMAFDYAAMILGVEGKCNHPRLLIHDSPREADMSADIYQRFFLFMQSIESLCKKDAISFQYIVTTTEPPPDELKKSPWLIDHKLDASSSKGRLLGVDL